MHVPRSFKDFSQVQQRWEELRNLPKASPSELPSEIELEFPEENPSYIAKFSAPFNFKTLYPNFYGPVSLLMRKEFSDNREEYPGKYKVIVNKFRLESKDGCTSNLAEVEMSADVFAQNSNQAIWNFRFSSQIDSSVTDCYIFLATIPIGLGWIGFGPYIGFRGNREDQLNQLGRVALLEFFDEWKKHPILGGKKKSSDAGKI
ncbi:hypothetical protein CH373_04355 [Leptospira perolatii]|uniref:Uncharacterized protein n=1 Tax=Leptospira perolatii TaxID=2023191 RepID=A0A2M9ZQV8_9LEPT|nr:hypothetical protein CH360_12975 [Leptospira perolatii]PJZ74458.1 hypothetical protein CH373_04355 [Leptospira perolatii]